MNVTELAEGIALPFLRKVAPYVPGKPIEELEREWGIRGSIKLASNENPLGPSPLAVEAMIKALQQVHRYPDGNGYYLRQRLGSSTGIPFEGIVLGNGSDEIMEMVVRAFMTSDDAVVIPELTFLLYSRIVQAVGGEVITVPLKSFRLDLETIARAVNEKTKIIFISNPNNPTGTAVDRGEFEAFLDQVPSKTMIVLDEAYIEFARHSDIPHGAAYLKDHPNLVVLRTFSKAYGMAGVRIGYGMMHPAVASFLNRVRLPFNTNSVAQAGAFAALNDHEFLERSRKTIWEGLDYFYTQLDQLGLEYVKTEANFFLVKVGAGRAVYEDMLREGVIIRCMDSWGMDSYVRINVGLPEENYRCIEALKRVLARREKTSPQ
jgi:histidinol-phosphate aminotransferase